METVNLEVQLRKDTGKTAVKQLNKQGLIPAVVYGSEKAPISITVNPKEQEAIYKRTFGKNTLIEMTIVDGTKKATEKVITYYINKHVIKRNLTHIDFLRVDSKKTIQLNSSIKLLGTPPGVKLGGIFVQKLKSIKIECLPENIPAAIEVDLSNLGIDQTIQIKDLNCPEIKILNPEKETIARVTSPKGSTESNTEDTEGDAANTEATAEGNATAKEESNK